MNAIPDAAAPGEVQYDLGPIDRIPPGEGQTFRVDDREIAVFRTRANEVYATQARCPHKAGLLADGLVGGGKVICPLHAYKFELASGSPVANGCTPLTTYPAEVTADGRVLVSVPRAVAAAWSSSP